MTLLILAALGVLWVWWNSRKESHKFSVKGKHVLVIGGSEGIGLECASEAVERGAAAVTIVSRSASKLQSAGILLRLARSKSGNNSILRCFVCDATDSEQVRQVMSVLENARGGHDKEKEKAGYVRGIEEEEAATYPAVDVVLCTAGICVCDRLTELSDGDLRSVIDTNLLTTLLPIRQWFKFRQRTSPLQEGAVVLFGSQASQAGVYGFSAYSCAKFGVRGLWEVLTLEGLRLGVTVHCAFPPNTDTPGFKVENIRKPAETKMIEDVGGLLTARQVAKTVLNAVETRKRRITFGIVGYMLAISSSGLSPCDGFGQLLADICLAPIGRLVGVALSYHWQKKLSVA